MMINENCLKKAVEYINASESYTFRNFIREHALDKDLVERPYDVVIRCPFHNDEAPSCSMNDTLHVFNCFSCGRHGSYVKFLALYSTEIEGIHLGYYQCVNSILKSDAVMQAALGFSTIYTPNKTPIQNKKREHFKAVKGKMIPDNYLELSSMMLARGCDISNKILAILLMQSHVLPEDIYNEIFEGKKHKHEKVYDLEEMTKEDQLLEDDDEEGF